MTNTIDAPANEEEPFQVVLIDMKKAAQGEIHCVEKPLMESGDLKFVAISYRWGELHETLVDTGLDYVASIVSFALDTLVYLCKTMTQERDLKYMDYVWVDAICVDQNNYERRKATIYHMTDIYERANYIVAVPDLHLEYLQAMNDINRRIMTNNSRTRKYIYYLIHGNVAQLEACDHMFLYGCDVPYDPYLRHLLINYTNHFATGFINYLYPSSCAIEANILDHIFSSHLSVKHHHNHGRNKYNQFLNWVGSDKSGMDLNKMTIDELHTCNNEGTCPLKLTFIDQDPGAAGLVDILNESKKAWILNRSQGIRQSMTLLTGLVKDWSRRAWVVSEYHIAKKKSNKMKYWFMQLDPLSPDPDHLDLDEYIFFEFDFSIHDDPQDNRAYEGTPDPSFVYKVFHTTMQEQLNRQTFLEKMLKTMATKNADRFHAILPSSEYKHILTNKEQVDSWNISSLTSVKLQLYEWMTTTHKLELLFLSSKSESSYILPTFATKTIRWPKRRDMYPTIQAYDGDYPCNFDLSSKSITLTKNKNGAYKLNVKPLSYYRHENYRQIWESDLQVDDKEEAIARRLLHLSTNDTLDYISIQDYGHKSWLVCYVFLLGSLDKNKWILKYTNYSNGSTSIRNDGGWHLHSLDKNGIGFDIY